MNNGQIIAVMSKQVGESLRIIVRFSDSDKGAFKVCVSGGLLSCGAEALHFATVDQALSFAAGELAAALHEDAM